MMITAHVPLGSHQFVNPTMVFPVEPDSPVTMYGRQIGTVLEMRGGAGGHTLDVDVELMVELDLSLGGPFSLFTFDPPIPATPTPEDQTT
jgi:hypothetical protein